MVRNTTYGGSAGIFVKRNTKSNSSISSKYNSSTNDGTVTEPATASIGIPPLLNRLIEWDHVKCRPIFRNESAVRSSNKFIIDKNDESANATARPLPKAGRRKARSYGSINRPPACINSNIPSLETALGTSTNKKPRLQSVQAFHYTGVNDSPSASFETSICSALNSSSKALPPSIVMKGSLVTTPVKLPKKLQHKRPAAAATNKHSLDPEMSLERAKAFFQHLDTNHHLVTYGGSTPQQNKTVCNIRTRRKLNIQDCRVEYDQYVDALTGISTTPMRMEQFALHRATFFTKRCFFDGCLDGF